MALWRFVGRYIDLNTMAVGVVKQVLDNQPLRLSARLLNLGAGTVRLTDRNGTINDATMGWPLPQNASLDLGSLGISPTNPVYAVGEAGHELVVMEFIGGQEVRRQG